MLSLVVALVVSTPEIPPDCQGPAARDVTALTTFAQSSGSLSVGLDSVATWCFDSGGTWTAGQTPAKGKTIAPNAEPTGDCRKAVISCEAARASIVAEQRQLLFDVLGELDKPFLGVKYKPKRSGLAERPSEVAQCSARDRSTLFSHAQARMDLARLASQAQNEYANYRTWLFAEGLKCAQALARGEKDYLQKRVAIDTPTQGGGTQVVPGAQVDAGSNVRVVVAGSGNYGATGGGNGASGSGNAGSGTSGNGTSGNGTSGNGTSANGTSANGTSANGTSANGTSANGTSGNGAGNGTSANGTSGNGTSGSGTSGKGTAGNGTAGNGTTGSGTTGNGTAGNGTTGNGTAGNGTAGNGTAGNGTAGNGTAGKGTAGNGTAGNGTSGNGTAGNGSAGNGTGTAGNGTAGNGTAGNGTAGNGTSGNGTAGNGTAGNGTAGNGTAGKGVGAGNATDPQKFTSTDPVRTGTGGGTIPVGGPTAEREKALASSMLEKWRYFFSEQQKVEVDVDWVGGFLASRELRDCRCIRPVPGEIVRRLENKDRVAQLEADDDKNTKCELCLLDQYPKWKVRAQKQCTLVMELSEFELGVLQRSDDGNGLPPRCVEAANAKRSGKAQPNVVVTQNGTTGAPSKPPTGSGSGTSFIITKNDNPTGDFLKPDEYAPIPSREEGRVYVRVFTSSACVAELLPGPVQARTGDLLPVPPSAKEITVRGSCGGFAEVYFGREEKPRVAETFARNQPLRLQFRQ
ncbi:MAG: hypothetical protein QM817_19050 [Archangium sp.]